MRRPLVVAGLVGVLVGGMFQAGATAKSIGGCPSGDSWRLVTVESLGIPEEQVSGLPSLDGNGDGWTCIAPTNANPNAPISGGFIFRDNTVGSTG
jgi:hypothetical protein